jgi:hypothetical protein
VTPTKAALEILTEALVKILTKALLRILVIPTKRYQRY